MSTNIFNLYAWKEFILLMRASSLINTKQYEKAKVILKGALERKKWVIEAHYYELGKIYYFQKEYEIAEKCFKTSLENNPYSNIGKANTFAYLALSQYEQRNFKEAIRNFETSINIKKNVTLWKNSVFKLADLYCFLGRTYIEIGEQDKARKIFEKGLSIDSDNKAIIRELEAYTYLKK